MSNHYGLTPDQILNPLPYETFGGHSQHGETGIISLMISKIKNPQNTFLEIGWGNGGGNMTIDLILKGWGGLGIDMFEQPHENAPTNDKFEYKKCKITPNNVMENISSVSKNVDFFSIDIDSYDFDICRTMLENDYRPKIVCAEFNPRFGNVVEASFPYKEIIPKKLYRKYGIYGASIKKYISLWNDYGYNFFTYDSSLTNLFFYNPEELNSLDEYPTHTLEHFPIKEDKNKQIIINHGMWIDELDTIYKDYK